MTTSTNRIYGRFGKKPAEFPTTPGPLFRRRYNIRVPVYATGVCGALLLCAPLLAQSGYRTIVHLGLEGQFSAVAVGASGEVWLSGNDGFGRFDGFRHTPVPVPFPRISSLAVTSDSAVWASGVFGLLRVHKGSPALIHQTLTYPPVVVDRQSVIFRDDRGLWRMDRRGKLTQIVSGAVSPLNVDADGKLWWTKERDGVWKWKPDGEAPPDRVTGGSDEVWDAAVGDRLGHVWVERNQVVRALDRFKGPGIPGKLQPAGALGTLIVGTPSVSLDGRLRLTVPEESCGSPNRVAGSSPDVIWGVFQQCGLVEWRREALWERWRSRDLGERGFAQTARLATGDTWLRAEGRIYRRAAAGWEAIGPPLQGSSLVCPSVNGTAWVMVDGWAQLLDAQGRTLETLPGGPYGAVFEPAPGEVWITGKNFADRIEGPPKQRRRVRSVFPGQHSDFSIYEMKYGPDGRLHVGWVGGIATYENGAWIPLQTATPFQDVRAMEFGQGGEIWVAHRRAASFDRLRRTGSSWTVEEFTFNNGYAPSKTHWVRVDSRGWLWRGVDDGVLVSNGRDLGPADWLFLNASSGYDIGRPHRVGFREDADGSIWIAGDRAVIHFLPDSGWFAPRRNTAPPLLSMAQVNNGQARFRIGGIERDPRRPKPIEYRIVPLFDWRGSASGDVDLEHLSPGSYRLEARYASAVGPMMRHEFHVAGNVRALVDPVVAVGVGAGLAGLAGCWIVVRRRLWQPWRYWLGKWWFEFRHRKSLLAMESDLRPGDVVGCYQIESLLTRGSIGRVYKAVRTDGHLAAVKILGPSGEPSLMRRRFAHEVAALSAASHPNIVRLIDSWVEPSGIMALALEFVGGERLSTLLERGILPATRTIQILRRLAEAVDALHNRGIIHLDLKPENVIMRGDEDPVLVDFGAAAYRGRAGELTETRTLTGTAVYMAPERLLGRYSAATDIFALAVIAVEMLTGKPASSFASSWFEQTFGAELPDSLPDFWPRESRAQIAVLLVQGLRADPADRPQNAVEWMRGLAAYLPTES